METNVLCHEQLFIDETCKNELDVAHYFTFKDSFNSCLPIVESNGVSEVVLKNGFNCDISSNVQTDFEMVPNQFGVVAHELSKNCALMSSL